MTSLSPANVIVAELANTSIQMACEFEPVEPVDAECVARVAINAPPVHYNTPSVFVGNKRINVRAEFYKLGRNYSAKMFVKTLVEMTPSAHNLGISIYVKNTDLSAYDVANIQAIFNDRKLPSVDAKVLSEHAWAKLIIAEKPTTAMLAKSYYYGNRTDDITKLLGNERMQTDNYKWLANYREIPINVVDEKINEAILNAVYMQILMGEHENGCLNICFNGYLPVFTRYDFIAYPHLRTCEYRVIVENTGSCDSNPALIMRGVIANIITVCYKTQQCGGFVLAGCEVKYAYKSFEGKTNPKGAIEYNFKVHYHGSDELLYIIDWCSLNYTGVRFSKVMKLLMESEKQ
ncbi:Hypothetical protein FSTVST1_49 [Faustovirus ST1]|nr:Hypothetical protein FSTVST1_49 [Faustovirus ST1]